MYPKLNSLGIRMDFLPSSLKYNYNELHPKSFIEFMTNFRTESISIVFPNSLLIDSKLINLAL